MGREIKFRVWRPQVQAFRFFDLSTGFNPENYDKFPPVMQYTGLKDKNGVEIYEGDIVDAVEFKPSVVNFESGTFRFWDLDAKDAEAFEWEVVGNIHQNPELLK
jgi:hypothetical protein